MNPSIDKDNAILELEKLLIKKEREIKSLNKDLVLQKEEINVQKEIIENQRDVALKQRDEIVYQQKEMTASFTYASRIQSAMLTSEFEFKKNFKDYFILYKPRNIVSGDFFWMTVKDDKIIVVAADATGHGVPGAFMSLMGIVFLNEIVDNMAVTKPGEILELMRQKIISAFDKEDGQGKINAGMDMTLITADLTKKHIQFAGAFNPIFIIRNNELIEIPGQKMPIGFHPYLMDNKFFTQDLDIFEGDRIYMFSDGYIDQFGWRYNKKFMKRNFKNLILEIQSVPVSAQKLLLENNFNNWKGDLEQVDDILVIGLQI